MTERGRTLVLRHVSFGWWCLALFMGLGLVLEAMHGFKVGWYLDLANETRRMMWRLSHAHGALLGMLNLLFAMTVHLGVLGGRARLLSRGLLVSSVLLPGGFFLGGVVVYEGDPGLGVLLAPLGALLLLLT